MNKKYFNLVVGSLFIFGLTIFAGCKDDSNDEPPCEKSTWYADNDGDGLGSPYNTMDACEKPEGYVDNSEDKVDKKATAKGIPMMFKSTGETCYFCGDWGWSAFTDIIEKYQEGRAFTWGNYGTGFSSGYFRSQEMTPTMQQLQTRFSTPSSKPNFVTNGKNYGVDDDASINAADEFIQKDNVIGLVMEAHIEGDRLVINAEGEGFSDATGTYVMGAYLIEDKVLGPQSGPIGDNGDVEHHNVMRGSLSDNAWGEVISESGIVAGTKYEKTYSIDIPKGYNKDNFSYGVIVWKRISTAHVFVNAYASH